MASNDLGQAEGALATANSEVDRLWGIKLTAEEAHEQALLAWQSAAEQLTAATDEYERVVRLQQEAPKKVDDIKQGRGAGQDHQATHHATAARQPAHQPAQQPAQDEQHIAEFRSRNTGASTLLGLEVHGKSPSPVPHHVKSNTNIRSADIVLPDNFPISIRLHSYRHIYETLAAGPNNPVNQRQKWAAGLANFQLVLAPEYLAARVENLWRASQTVEAGTVLEGDAQSQIAAVVREEMASHSSRAWSIIIHALVCLHANAVFTRRWKSIHATLPAGQPGNPVLIAKSKAKTEFVD